MKTQMQLFHGVRITSERNYMKQVHGYRKGECDPKEGRQLTICGRPVYQFDRYVVNIRGEEQHGRHKITCSTCLAKISVTRETRTSYITKHTG